jgi:hypothetical protein
MGAAGATSGRVKQRPCSYIRSERPTIHTTVSQGLFTRNGARRRRVEPRRNEVIAFPQEPSPWVFLVPWWREWHGVAPGGDVEPASLEEMFAARAYFFARVGYRFTG